MVISGRLGQIAWLLCGVGCGGAQTVAKPDSTGAESKSSWVDTSVARIRVDSGDAGGLRGCTGSLTPEAKAFFTKLYAEVSNCAAAERPKVKGSVTFHSTLEVGGGLSEFAVLEDKVGAPTLIQCIQGRAFSAEYPEVDPKTPCVQLVHPMLFE